jgi:hypothetical protein
MIDGQRPVAACPARRFQLQAFCHRQFYYLDRAFDVPGPVGESRGGWANAIALIHLAI